MTNKTASNIHAKAHLFKDLSFIIVRDSEGYRASLSMSCDHHEFFQVFRRLVRTKFNVRIGNIFVLIFLKLIFSLKKDLFIELSYIDHTLYLCLEVSDAL